MNEEIISLIRKLKENVDCIPPVFWRSSISRNRNKHTISLLENKFGIQRNGNIVFRGDRGFVIKTFKTFNINPVKFSSDEENQIKKAINEYLLFYKDRYKTLTARDILKCENLEIKQTLLRRYGYEKFVRDLRGIKVQEDKFGELVKLNFKGEETMKFVKVKDSSTDRIYVIRVPSEIKTCREGVAWTFGLRTSEYNPKKET
jgi:hypothetical protein